MKAFLKRWFLNLEDFYDNRNVPEEQRIKSEKNIVLIVPDKDTDISWFFDEVGIDQHEVAITWPNKSIDLVQEISLVMPKIVIQLGDKFSRRYPFLNDEIPDEWKRKIKEATADNFVVLHHHDEYSLKDGLGTVEQLTKVLKKQRRSFCCVTNHGSVGGWIKQFNACKKAGVKPIFGMEAYVSNYRGNDPIKKKEHRSANHLILLAKNETGFYNIIQIHNDAQLNGFYYSPRMNHEAAKKWGEGIIGTSACMAGEIPQALMEDDFDKAKEAYEVYCDSFDEFYIELQIIEFEMQREVNRRLIEFAQAVGAPVIMACDSHYLDPTHADTHDLLMYIRQGKTKLDAVENNEDVWDFEVRNLFYRSHRQMEEVFREGFVTKDKETRPAFLDDVFTEEVFKEAMDNTVNVARQVETINLDSTVKLPKLYKDSESILRDKVNAGFKKLGLNKKPNKEEYIERLRYEFGIITKLGWADYFLVMEKIIRMAKDEFYEEVGEWAIGYGRGSAAGCLISWCLGLTDCDPLEYGLLFERFLDEGRPDPPDIDTDFHPAIRQRVKDKIVEMFGEEKTCSIGTYSTYKTKVAIIDVARALGYDPMEANSVTKEMDSLKSFEMDGGDEEIVDKMDFDELCKHYPALDEYFDKYPDVKIHASIIRNQVKNMGKHAGGVIISDMDLSGKIPVQYEVGGGKIISSWAESGNTAELSQVGLVKYDILGLNNLPIIADCIRLVKENRGIDIKRAELPLDDKKTIRMETKGDLKGIFQFENPATKPISDKVGVESLNDVSAVTSLLRPGPKDMGMHMEYAERKNGKPFDVIPCLDWIFKDTYGILVYQEQMMQISQELCGFDGPMSNKLRKACGKKLKDLMISIKQKFIEGAQPRIEAGEVTLEQVEELWELIVAFAKYGFNKSHAVTYSMITTAELWLKHNYFLEYMTALVQNTDRGKKKHGSSDIMVDYLNYVRKKSIEVLAPDINASRPDFHIHKGSSMRYGLGHIKNVASAAHNITKITSQQPFVNMIDFHDRCVYETAIKSGANAGKMRIAKPNNKVVESLVFAGAFDRFGDRNEVMTEYNIARLGIPHPTDEEIEEVRENILNGICPTINDAFADFSIIKSVGQVGEHITAIAKEEPYESMADFHERCVYETEIRSGRNAGDVKLTRPNKRVVENLIYAGAFREFGDVRQMFKEYHLAKNKMKPVNYSSEELELKEIEMIGLCLSKEPICRQYHELMVDNEWSTISSLKNYKRLTVFGRIEMISPRTSKAGNSMYVVRMSDGLDKIDFFVFKAGMDYFRESVKKGQLAAIPLDKFDDGDARFFNDRGEICVVNEN
jgi:DNA polymerase-3 subunit alpha